MSIHLKGFILSYVVVSLRLNLPLGILSSYPFSKNAKIFARVRQFWKDCSFSGNPNDTHVSGGVARWDVKRDVEQRWSIDFEQL